MVFFRDKCKKFPDNLFVMEKRYWSKNTFCWFICISQKTQNSRTIQNISLFMGSRVSVILNQYFKMGCCGSKKYEMNEEVSKGGLKLKIGVLGVSSYLGWIWGVPGAFWLARSFFRYLTGVVKPLNTAAKIYCSGTTEKNYWFQWFGITANF